MFKLLRKKCNGVYIFPGNMNVFLYPKPRDIHIHYKKNAISPGSQSHLTLHDIILIYGKFNNKTKRSVYDVPFCRNYFNDKYIHPCPNNERLYKLIISQIKPKSVLDPFLGSGTTAEVCEELGIHWLGYEIMEDYIPDIEKRIKRGIKNRKLNNTKNLRKL
jgi:DNA modification methylase